MENILKTLAKSVLIKLGLTVAESVTDAAIQMNIFGLAIITLIIWCKWRNQWYHENGRINWRMWFIDKRC